MLAAAYGVDAHQYRAVADPEDYGDKKYLNERDTRLAASRLRSAHRCPPPLGYPKSRQPIARVHGPFGPLQATWRTTIAAVETISPRGDDDVGFGAAPNSFRPTQKA